ncbi:hypothetical protein GCM10011613_35450 [Cellvibrio zantedeschiae]|uniref:CAAX prenyl protease 2/Lysostaphin resistance protein A-like domain-containing protein n=1 Tax=Cellvibrio zantedeschiae TaxID=1237077 RepID=A0ABQ3BD68_9GAMM|nr:type II CAAX endopeptidase family protein [Cellvibrio zantedeschiae]GGY87164.1 hypothetical protein GCM10011613_35450 [Cellvibrio zantedeschiae]
MTETLEVNTDMDVARHNTQHQSETEEPNQYSPEPMLNLPRVGSSIGWMVVFFLMSALSGFLYAVYFGLQEGFIAGLHHTEVDASTFGVQIKNNLETPIGRTITAVLQFVLVIPIIFFAAKFPGQSAAKTLAITKVPKNILRRWILYFAGYWLFSVAFLHFIHETDSSFTQSLRGSKHFGLAITIAVIAPIIEELIFRGYLYKAWRFTRLGFVGALILISALFTVIHAGQYQWPTLLVIFCFSVLLGTAREKTGSVLVPILLHAINNTLAAVLVIYLGANI